MNVLIIKNISNEGPGTIEDYLKEKGAGYQILDFSDCSATGNIPDTRGFTHLVIMGGPMAVYESEGLPFLHYEQALIRVFIKQNKPVLGICLGAQMIAHALGARVYAGKTKEIGWYKVALTPEGMEDPVMAAISVNNAPYAEVFQWHGDTFDLPANALRIASSEVYENQAFRYKDNVYALQFHIEVRPEIVKEWLEGKEDIDLDDIMKTTGGIYPEYYKRAMKFYEKFFT